MGFGISHPGQAVEAPGVVRCYGVDLLQLPWRVGAGLAAEDWRDRNFWFLRRDSHRLLKIEFR